MSRNGPYGQGRAPQRRAPAEHDPYANGQGGQWPPQAGGYPEAPYNGGPQQGYNGNGAQQGYGPQHAQQGFHYPQAHEPDPQYYQQQGQGQPQSHGQLPGFDRNPMPAGPAQGGYQPQQTQPQWGQQDPRNYDLGGYAQTGFAPAEPPQHFQHAPEPAPFAGGQQNYAEPETDYDDVLADEDDEPHNGRRWMVIAAALVGAICLGGGLAYSYKMLFSSNSGRAPIVRPIDFPNKVKPTAGKETAQGDKKLFTRLGEDGPTAAKLESDAEATEDRPSEAGTGGPRPVRIIPIVPGGGGQVTTTGGVTPPKPTGGQIAVPGLFIDTPTGPRTPFPQTGGIEPSGAQKRPPERLAERPPERIPAPSSTSSTGPTTPAAGPRIPVPKAKEASAANVVTPVSSGYVAVLSSQRSRMDAMKAYASIDQKYRDMLSSSTFDVQEADLGEKGIWYRAVVGPPRSFDGAKKICEELKAAGYPACWPARY